MRCLIVGQGIAGVVLAWTLRQRGVQTQVADAGHPYSSSAAAAGIINPISGKRFVKSWRFEAFFAAARATYQAMESKWNIPIWQDQLFFRLLDTPAEINDWSARMADPEYSLFMGERTDAGHWSKLLRPGFVIGEIRQAARVDFTRLIEGFRRAAISNEIFMPQSVLPAEHEKWAAEFDFLVFCEGYRGAENPLFPGLPWQLCKGDALVLSLVQQQAFWPEEMIKKRVTLAPLGNGFFWAGASYRWTFEDNGCTDSEQKLLEQQIAEMLQAPFQVLRRMGAVRPAVKDRRPFLGPSPLVSNIYIFNGLGTKGALLAPYWANHLADHILEGKPLDAAVDIRRFVMNGQN